MNINLIAVGTRMPDWVNQGYQDYAQRLPRDYALKLIAIPSKKRYKSTDTKQLIKLEGQQLLTAVPKHSLIIALDRSGRSIDSPTLATQLENWHHQSQSISLLIGGPEGLSQHCLKQASHIWSLSKLTLPHPLVRIVVAEQLYRAWSIISRHPYHR